MIITISNFCQNIGKTTISLFLSHYLLKHKITEKVFIIDEDKNNELSQLFVSEEMSKEGNLICHKFDDEISILFKNEVVLSEMDEDKSIYIVDLKSTFDKNFIPLLQYSTFVISPFSNFPSVINSTIKFGELINKICDLNSNLVFIENFGDRDGYLSEEIHNELSEYGMIIDAKILYDKNFSMTFRNENGNGIQFKAVFDEFSNLFKK